MSALAASSAASAAIISSRISLAAASPLLEAREQRASSRCPRRYSQRGDSFSLKAPKKRMRPGMAEHQKMTCQAIVLLSAVTLGSSAAPTHMVVTRPMRAANTRPTVSMNWNMPVPLPRELASRHSARYMGTTTPTRPALAPCRIRPPISISNTPLEKQMTGMLSVNSRADRMMTFLRPSHSASMPANREERTEPKRTAATTMASSCGV